MLRMLNAVAALHRHSVSRSDDGCRFEYELMTVRRTANGTHSIHLRDCCVLRDATHGQTAYTVLEYARSLHRETLREAERIRSKDENPLDSRR